MTEQPALVLHSSIWRLTLQSATPVFLLAFGLGALAEGGGAISAAIVVLGIGTALVVLLDLPIRTEFDEHGLLRVCPLRRQRLPWDEVVAVERVRGLTTRRSADGNDDRAPGTGRGLAARTGPRRVHLLVDRRESRAEYRVLHDLLDDRGTRLRAAEPPIDAAPAGRGPRALHRRGEGA